MNNNRVVHFYTITYFSPTISAIVPTMKGSFKAAGMKADWLVSISRTFLTPQTRYPFAMFAFVESHSRICEPGNERPASRQSLFTKRILCLPDFLVFFLESVICPQLALLTHRKPIRLRGDGHER